MSKPVLTLVVIFASHVAYADTLTLDPDPNSSLVSQPQLLTYPDQSMVTVQNAALSFRSPNGATPSWSVTFQAPIAQTLQTGCYERTNTSSTAQRASLRMIFASESCSSANARFKVLDVQRTGGAISSFAADFVAPCGTKGRVVRGRLRYNSVIGINTPPLRPTFDLTGTMSVVAAAGALGGGPQGTTRAYTLSRSFVDVFRNFENGASILYDEFDGGGSSLPRWSLAFAGPDDTPLQVGSYPNATRFSFQAAGVPGLDYTFGSSGCNQVFGSFNVSAITYDAIDGIPLQLSASFVHRCETQNAPIASGTISYSLNPVGPTTVPNPEILFASGMESGELVGFYTPTCDQ